MRSLLALSAASALLLAPAAQADPCARCDEWNKPHAPFKIYGNTYYVGTAAITSILITSDKGHVLVDGGNPRSPQQLAASIKALGFKVEDVRLILNTHVHYDHAGGIAELQRMSGAAVKASPLSAETLGTGKPGAGDPQHDTAESFPAATGVATFADGEVLRVGALALTAHFTPGHTPGGTSWTWQSCEGTRCLHIAYLDSLNAVSAPTFKFSDSPTYPTVLSDFEKSFAAVSALPCDIALANHPDNGDFWQRLDRRDQGNPDGLIDREACRRYAQNSKARLEKRLAAERGR
jgi:metallo-beta-lactamase class B